MEPLRYQWGRNIRKRRQAMQLTQRQLADLLGVDQGAVSGWEIGRNGPSDRYKIALAKALEIDANLLFPLPSQAVA